MNDAAINFLKSIPWLDNQLVEFVVYPGVIYSSNNGELKDSRKLFTADGGASFHRSDGLDGPLADGFLLLLTLPTPYLDYHRRDDELVIDASHGKIELLYWRCDIEHWWEHYSALARKICSSSPGCRNSTCS